MVLPLVLGLLGRRVGSSGESGLMNLLGKPQAFLQDAPGALAGVLGMGSAARPVMTGIEPHVRHTPSTAGASPLRKWMLPILLLLGLLVALAYFMSRREQAPTTAPAIAPVVAGPELGPLTGRTLPNGVTLQIPANGVESKLIAFIENQAAPVSATTWFSFDRLEFDTAAATLKPSSQEQVRNIAEIMKAYPQVTVKFGGYTDNTGNAEKNVELSRQRAISAMNQVVALGVDAARLNAEGYGEQNPIADNATPEGRQRNRRVDINVTAK
jgi:OmpA-OmpF porin, OOP family